MAEMMMYDSSMLVWCDESGCDRRKLIRGMVLGEFLHETIPLSYQESDIQ